MTTRTATAADRRAGALRRRPAGERAAGRRQRGDAGRARNDGRGVRLWRSRRCVSCCARKPRHDVTGLHRTLALAEPILAGLGFGAGPRRADRDRRSRCARRGAARDRAPGRRAAAGELPCRPAASATCMRLALRELHRAAPAPVDVIALPAGAPFGTVELNVEGCTLCLACVSACPTGALSATIPSGRCCVSPRMPACNADCARRPARRRSSR